MRIRPMGREDVEGATKLRMALLAELDELPPGEAAGPLRDATRSFLRPLLWNESDQELGEAT